MKISLKIYLDAIALAMRAISYWTIFELRYNRAHISNLGVVESRWAPRSSKSVAGRVAGRGGFDSHPFPPILMMSLNETESPTHEVLFSRLVGRVLRIDDTTWGSSKQGYLARFRGQLLIDSVDAFDQLAQALKPKDITPIFRNEDDKHVIYLMESVANTKKSNPWINLGLFLLTVVSVLIAGTLYGYEGPVSDDPIILMKHIFSNLLSGVPFAASMLGILLAHEFGHYLAARYHKTNVTLPYFIPFPLSLFGTMGAFIQLKEPPRNKRILLDIGIAGPLAGFVVAVPILMYGLFTSEVHPLPAQFPDGMLLEGNSLLYLLAKYAATGLWLPEPVSFGALHPIIYWIRYFFTGYPSPLGGTDILLNDYAWAGWAGLLVTALNLIPAGQLDGGHLIYVLFGKRATRLLPYILGTLLLLGLIWQGWWLWAVLIFILGRVHAEPLDQITQLDRRRKYMAVLGLIIFVLVFTPIPLMTGFGG